MNLKMKTATAMAALLIGSMPALAGMEEGEAFLKSEIGDLTSLSPDEAKTEMQWFVDAAKPYQGMEVHVVSESLTTHAYESKVLAPAFSKITGIKVIHDTIQEGDVVEKIQTQMQTGNNIYDA